MRKENIIIILLVVIIVMLSTVGIFLTINNKCDCKIINDISDNDINEERYQTGVIKEISKSKDNNYGTIFIEEDNYKAYVTITKDTIISKGSMSRPFGFDEFKVGDTVKILVPEVIIEIYPYLYDTTWINIIE